MRCCGVPQWSVLGLLLFLIMIDDIDKGIKYSRVTHFSDDTRTEIFIYLLDMEDKLNKDLHTICNLANENNMKFTGYKF